MAPAIRSSPSIQSITKIDPPRMSILPRKPATYAVKNARFDLSNDQARAQKLAETTRALIDPPVTRLAPAFSPRHQRTG